ncbi:hypothetical protein [Spongiimicrobium salis]|uniref:hypothetical protein n=1 Tax=Spongiimicrobium salis TaxID=1667022 RepID=UPI00374CB322
MGNKKEIGRFFRERIGTQESEPNDSVWDAIISTLERKRRYRLFFLIFGGIIGISVGLLIYRSFIANNTSTLSTKTPLEYHHRIEKTPSSTIPEVFETHQKTSKTSQIPYKNAQNEVQDTLRGDQQSESTHSKPSLPTVVTTKETSKKGGRSKPNPKTFNRITKNREEAPVKGSVNTFSNPKSSSEEFYDSSASDQDLGIDSQITQLSQNTTTQISPKTKTFKDRNIGSSLRAQNKLQNTPVITRDSTLIEKDSTALSPNLPESKEEKPEDNEEKKPMDQLLDRATISVHAGPIYFGNLASKYPIFNEGVNRKKGADIGFAYGFFIHTIVTPKLTVSAGLNRFNISYTARDIAGGVDAFGRPVILDNSNTRFFPILLNADQINTLNTESNLSITHKIAYTEVPVEIAYSLNMNKWSLHVLGGLDILLLRKNSIDLNSASVGSIEIGTADYLKELSFGSHIGLNIKHELTKTTSFYLKPLVKYQFRADDGIPAYRPFYFGVLTGLEFKLR